MHTGSAPAAVVAMAVVAAARAAPTRRLVKKRMAVMAHPRLMSVGACVGTGLIDDGWLWVRIGIGDPGRPKGSQGR
jgi:hypothetical protein